MSCFDPFTKHPVIMAALNVGDQEKTLHLGQARVQALLSSGFHNRADETVLEVTVTAEMLSGLMTKLDRRIIATHRMREP